MNIQMEEVHRARYVGKGRRASMPSLGAPLSQHLCAFTPEALCAPIRLGFLWKLHHISMTDN